MHIHTHKAGTVVSFSDASRINPYEIFISNIRSDESKKLIFNITHE